MTADREASVRNAPLPVLPEKEDFFMPAASLRYAGRILQMRG